MSFSDIVGSLALALVALMLSLLLYWYWRNRRQLDVSTKYLLDRLRVAESDIHRLKEDLFVLREYLSRKGLLDDDDLATLRRELIELPRQMEAERAELLKGVLEKEEEERLVKNIPDTLH
jgi:DNA polymerase III delta prime subunit